MHNVFWLALASALVGIGILTRIRGVAKLPASHDMWYYFLAADEIRKESKLPDEIDNFIFEGKYDYPPVLPTLLSLFPKKSLEKYWKSFPIIVESVHMFLVWFVAQQITGTWILSLTAVGIYAVTPILIFEFIGLNTRPLGSLLLSACLLSLFSFSVGGGTYLFILAVFLGMAVLLTHKFATQTLFFILIFFSVWETSLLYIAFLGFIGGLAILVSRGFYLKVLRSHYHILKFWRENINLLGKPLLSHLKEEKKRGEGEKGKSLFQKFREAPRRYKIFSHPALNLWAFLLPISIIFLNGQMHLSGFSEKLMLWGFAILGLFILVTYIPQLQFVGRGRRYFEYGALPISIVVSLSVFNINSSIFLLLFLVTLGASIIVTPIVQELQIRHPESVYPKSLKGIFEHIKDSDKQNVMCIPIGLSYPTAYFTRKKVLFHDSPLAFDRGKDFFPVATKPLSLIAEKHYIDFVLVDSTLTGLSELGLKNFKVKLKENRYFLLERANE